MSGFASPEAMENKVLSIPCAPEHISIPQLDRCALFPQTAEECISKDTKKPTSSPSSCSLKRRQKPPKQKKASSSKDRKDIKPKDNKGSSIKASSKKTVYNISGRVVNITNSYLASLLSKNKK